MPRSKETVVLPLIIRKVRCHEPQKNDFLNFFCCNKMTLAILARSRFANEPQFFTPAKVFTKLMITLFQIQSRIIPSHPTHESAQESRSLKHRRGLPVARRPPMRSSGYDGRMHCTSTCTSTWQQRKYEKKWGLDFKLPHWAERMTIDFNGFF